MERSLELFHDYGFWKTTLFLVIFILAGIIELIINVLFIHFIRKHAEGNRPVNLFIVIDQALRFVAIFTLWQMGILVLTTDSPPIEYIGENGCLMVRGIQSGLMMSTIISTWGMCLFRFICLVTPKYPLRYGVNVIRNTIVLLQISLSIFYAYCMIEYKAFQRTDRLCRGITQSVKQSFSRTKAFVLGITQVLNVFKTVMYIIIYFKLKNSDKSISTTMNKKQMRQRRLKNVVTFSGEVITFLVSFGSLLTLHILQKNGIDWEFIRPEASLFNTVFIYSLISISLVISSPEMMRFIFKIDF